MRACQRDALERLARYLLRPPLAKDRIRRREDGRVEVHLRRTWSDGTRALLLTPLQLVERLIALIPPARTNQVTYSGVFAANHRWRREVVPKPPLRTDPRPLSKARAGGRTTQADDRSMTWAELLRRVFRVDGWACPSCRQPMRLRAVLHHPPDAGRVLRGLDRATGPPGVAAPAR